MVKLSEAQREVVEKAFAEYAAQFEDCQSCHGTYLSERIALLTKNERRYLSRRVCGFCGGWIVSRHCGAIWEKCSEQDRLDRLTRCLAEYKPRGGRKDGK